VAPVVGAYVLTAFSWRATFCSLSLVGIAGIVLALLFKETVPETTVGRCFTFAEQLGRIGCVLGNPGFVLRLIVLSFFMASFTVYVSMASYIYIDFFGTTAQQFSFFFAAAALLSSSGLVLYPLLLRKVSKLVLTSTLLVFAGLSLCAEGAWGSSSPWAFFLLLLPHYFGIIVLKPYFVNYLLSREDDDTGVVASLAMFSPNLVGCVASQCMAAMGPNYVGSYLAVSSFCLAVAVIAWTAVVVAKSRRVHGGK